MRHVNWNITSTHEIYRWLSFFWASLVAQTVKSLAGWLQCERLGFNPWVRKIPWRREWLLTSIFLPGEFHEQRSLEGLVHGVAECQTKIFFLELNLCALFHLKFKKPSTPLLERESAASLIKNTQTSNSFFSMQLYQVPHICWETYFSQRIEQSNYYNHLGVSYFLSV